MLFWELAKLRLLEQHWQIRCYKASCTRTVTRAVLTLTEKFFEDKAQNVQEAVLLLLGLDIGQLITPKLK